jgi:hypothetical protein
VCRFQWPCGLRRGSAVVRLLGLWVWIPPREWMFVCCESCVLLGKSVCIELTTRSEESYRVWCVVVCDKETSWIMSPWHTGGCSAKNKHYNYASWCCFCNWSVSVWVSTQIKKWYELSLIFIDFVITLPISTKTPNSFRRCRLTCILMTLPQSCPLEHPLESF